MKDPECRRSGAALPATGRTAPLTPHGRATPAGPLVGAFHGPVSSIREAQLLLRVETRAGRGAGKPKAKQMEDTADRWAFLVKALHMEAPAR